MKSQSILKKLSLDEKIAQLCAINSAELIDDRRVNIEKCGEAFRYGAGAMTGAGGPGGIVVGGGCVGGDYAADEVVLLHRDLQEALLQHAPHPIPAIMVEECLSGYQQRDATVYPQSIALASTWNPEGVRKMTSQIGQLLRASGVQQALSPVLDLVCDPRWGRNEETYGEDPVLAAAMATAFVTGLQGSNLSTGVAATLKHFVGYGLTEAGRNLAPLRAGERLIRDQHLLPFESALRASAASVMSAYSDLDGEVITTSRYWLGDVLRGELGFHGTVVCDFGAIDMLTMIFRTARSPEEAVAQSFNAGVDMDFPSGNNYRTKIKGLLEAGIISENALDERVSRVLKLKERLGLLSGDASHYLPTAQAADFDSAKQRQLAYDLALDGVTLLKNDGLLPLSAATNKLAVIGPNADAADALLGDYSYTGARRGFWWPRMENPGPLDEIKAQSVFQVLSNKTAGKIDYQPGCSLLGDESDEASIAEACAAAADCELAIVVAGESSTTSSGECRDRHEIGLPGRQAELIQRVAATGTPIVLVLLHGRPLDLSEVEPHCAAILTAWFPGDHGAAAIADVLLGEADPAGRLPVSFPRSLGLYPDHSRLSLNAKWEKLLGGIRPTPLYPFGHGLSYSDFEYSGLDTIEVDAAAREVRFTCTVRNSGPRAASEVVQVYVGDEAASLVQPEFALKTFCKLHLAPGESTSLRGCIPFCALSFHDRTLKRITEAGRFELRIARSYADIQLRNSFDISEDYRPDSYFEKEAFLKPQV
jgi:beta-glucosidase